MTALIEQACQSCGDLYLHAGPIRDDYECMTCLRVGAPIEEEGESFPSRCGYCSGGYVHTPLYDGTVLEDLCVRCGGSYEA